MIYSFKKSLQVQSTEQIKWQLVRGTMIIAIKEINVKVKLFFLKKTYWKIRKEKTKNKFKEKLSSEMVKLHERVPIDRQVRGFRKFFYWSIKTKLFIYLRGDFENVNI